MVTFLSFRFSYLTVASLIITPTLGLQVVILALERLQNVKHRTILLELVVTTSLVSHDKSGSIDWIPWKVMGQKFSEFESQVLLETRRVVICQ